MSQLDPQRSAWLPAITGRMTTTNAVTAITPPLIPADSRSVEQFNAVMAPNEVPGTSSTILIDKENTTKNISVEEQEQRKQQWLAGADLPTVLSGLPQRQQTDLCWNWYRDEKLSAEVYQPLRNALEGRLFSDAVSGLKLKFDANYSQQLAEKYGENALSALQNGNSKGVTGLKCELDSGRREMTAWLKTEFKEEFSLGKRREELLLRTLEAISTDDNLRGLQVLLRRELVFLIQQNSMVRNMIQHNVKPEIEE